VITLDELSKLTINFCGKERHFKRCPSSQLTKYTEAIEELQMSVQNKGQEAREKEIEADNLDAQAQLKKDDDEKLDLLERANQCRADAKAIRDEVMDSAKEQEKEMQKRYAELCCQLLEPLTVEEFMENFDSRDMALVQGMGIIYDMYMSDFPEVKIKNKIGQMIEAHADLRLKRTFQIG